MKKLFSTLIILAMLIAAIPMTANAITEGDWEFQILNNQAKITRYLGSERNVVIPAMIYGVPVTELSDDIFMEHYNENCKNIVSLTIPATVKEIPKGFVNSTLVNLETVVLPEGIEKIGDNAFYGLRNLKSINLPSSLKTIGSRAFNNCTSLTKINFPAGLEQLGESNTGVFQNCGLVDVDLSKCTNLKTLGGGIFKNCSNLRTAVLPEGIEEITPFMFQDCVSLTNVLIPSTVKSIGGYSFEKCQSLNQIVLPAGLNDIQGYAFSYCSKLEEVIVPFGTKEVSHAFQYCNNLRKLYIPETVSKLSDSIIRNSDNCIIFCSENSQTANHCRKNEISYLIDNSVNASINVVYNNKRISFEQYGQFPYLLNGRTLVPLRSIFEAMGANVEWDGNTGTAIARRGGDEVKIQIGATEMYKNGKPIQVDVPAQIMNNRTMVPVRVIAEAFGSTVSWNAVGNLVLISDK